MWYKSLTERQKIVMSVLAVAAALGLPLSAYGGYKYVYLPWDKRRLTSEAENYTGRLFEQE